MIFPKNFYEWLDFWLEYYHKPKVKESTYNVTVYKLRMLKKQTHDTPIELIDEFYCQNILNKMFDDNYSKSTITKIYEILNQVLGQAKKKNCILANPAGKLVIPKAHTKCVEALTIEQQLTVIEYCNKLKNGCVFVFLINTGLRRSELINLKLSDFNDTTREIFIRKSKTENGIRTIPLLNIAYQIIVSQQKSLSDDYIFHGAHGGRLTSTIMKSLYTKVREATGIKTFTNHVCRHTFATRLIELGASPKSVAALLGHSKVEYALNIYTNIRKQHMRKEIFLLEAI